MLFMRLVNNNASVKRTVYAKFDKSFLKKWARIRLLVSKTKNSIHMYMNSSGYEMLDWPLCIYITGPANIVIF